MNINTNMNKPKTFPKMTKEEWEKLIEERNLQIEHGELDIGE